MASDDERLPAEARARTRIDAQLAAAGWQVQDGKALNLFAGPGIAVREVVMAPGHGRVDYLLYVGRKVVGVIEAKPEGTALSGVEWQSAMYVTGLPEGHRKRSRAVDGRLPFVFEAPGTETHFTNGFAPDPHARAIFHFPRPSTLARIVRDAHANAAAPTWRGKVRARPEGAQEGELPAPPASVRVADRQGLSPGPAVSIWNRGRPISDVDEGRGTWRQTAVGGDVSVRRVVATFVGPTRNRGGSVPLSRCGRANAPVCSWSTGMSTCQDGSLVTERTAGVKERDGRTLDSA
jgi:hypothetical protein